jgi:hypothetical protein
MGGQVNLLGHGSAAPDAGVAAGGTAEAEPAAQGAGLVPGAERAALLQFGDQPPGDRLEVAGDGAGAQPEAGQARALPVQQQAGELGGRAGEDGRVAGERVAGQLVKPRLAAASSN